MKRLIFLIVLIVAFATSSFAFVNPYDISTGYCWNGQSNSQGYSNNHFLDLHVDLYVNNNYCVATGGGYFYMTEYGYYLGSFIARLDKPYDGGHEYSPPSIVAPSNTGYAVVFASTFIEPGAPAGSSVKSSSTLNYY